MTAPAEPSEIVRARAAAMLQTRTRRLRLWRLKPVAECLITRYHMSLQVSEPQQAIGDLMSWPHMVSLLSES